MALHTLGDPYQSDSSFTPDDNDLSNDDPTPSLRLDPIASHDASDDSEADVDSEDIQLFSGNLHPPEYYRHALMEFNEEAYSGQNYSAGTTVLLDAMEEQWSRYSL